VVEAVDKLSDAQAVAGGVVVERVDDELVADTPEAS